MTALSASIGNARTATLDAITEHTLAGRDTIHLTTAATFADTAVAMLDRGNEDGARAAVVRIGRYLSAAGAAGAFGDPTASSCRGLAAVWRRVLLANPR